MMKSKIHRATVTEADLDYVGSITIDKELMALADLVEFEQVSIYNLDNGARLETYVIAGKSSQICINGPAAHLVSPGHKVIIVSYADYGADELSNFAPVIVHVDENNNEKIL